MKLSNFLILGVATVAVFGVMKHSGANSLAPSLSVQPATQLAQSPPLSLIKSGKFVSGEHQTLGTVRVTTKNGKSFITLDRSFKTSTSGPDLVVILHRSPNVISSTKPPAYPIKKGDYFVVAPLKKYSGSQTYAIPNNIKLSDYKSVAIWCRQFNATFGAASLSS